MVSSLECGSLCHLRERMIEPIRAYVCHNLGCAHSPNTEWPFSGEMAAQHYHLKENPLVAKLGVLRDTLELAKAVIITGEFPATMRKIDAALALVGEKDG